MRVDVYSHSFKVTEVSERQRQAVERFARTFIQYETVVEDGRKYQKATKVYASAFHDRRYYRFHVNCLDDFKQAMAYYQIASTEINYHTHEPVVTHDHKVDFEVKFMNDPRDPQPAIIEHILSPGPNKIVNLQTGKGKTFLTKYSLNKMGLRTVIFMKGGFIDRWVPDMEETFKFRKGDLLVVRGSAALNAIMEMALENELRAQVIFISVNTFTEYLKTYEREGVTDLYPIEPDKFYETLKIGVGALDEGHQNPHQAMKLFCYMHIYKFITLSATLDTKDRFMTAMYEAMYPRAERFNAGYYDAYIRVVALRYQLMRPKAVRYTGFGGAYSHAAFENSLMSKRNKYELKNYVDMITFYVQTKFVDIKQPKQKMIVFCGTVKFCTMLTKYLQNKFRHLKVARYVAEDKMSVLNDADIVVSTVLSAGTAVDIPDLLCTLMTTAIDSQQSNEQTLGRTRRLKSYPDITPCFYYFVCTSIDKHVRYHRNKIDYFRGKVLAHVEEQSPISV